MPIRELLDYFVSQNYDPGFITLSSIVCTKDYEVKFIDGFFRAESISLRERPNFKTNLYEEFTHLLFDLLFPFDKHLKSLKSRY